MSKKATTVKNVNWIAIIPQGILLTGLTYLFMFLKIEEPFVMACLLFFLLGYGTRGYLTKSHRQGITATKKGDFAQAIPLFEESYRFFLEHKWVDQFRSIILLSASSWKYREMALVNIAFCYSQLNDGAKAREYYSKTLEEFPNNIMAKNSLAMLDAGKSEALD